MINQTLNNRYKISSRLGKGAMGTVYLATDTQNGKEVALKIIASDLAIEPDMLERFKREGEALRQLKHPNIVGFIDAFQHEETYVIVMEHVSGGSLYDLLKKGILPIEQARQIALDLCDALIRAHRLNIIHRDIKPENILIDADGTPKLADFGVARLSEGTRMTKSGMQVGTPYYMSPEAWKGEKLDGQTDIWSLGVVLFEMLSGKVPFEGDTGHAVMTKVFSTQAPDLRKLRSEVPSALGKIVGRMLARDKKRRYQSIRQVGVDLESGQMGLTPKPIQPITFDFSRYRNFFIVVTIIVGVILTINLFSKFLLSTDLLSQATETAETSEEPAVSSGGSVPTNAKGQQILKVWSFTNEIQTMAIAFEGKHPDVDVQFTMIPMTNGEYQTKIKAAIGTDEVPDVVALEAAFVKEWVEADFLADLNDLLPLSEELKTYPSVVQVGTHDGVTKAFSYQTTPGAFFYRRSIAQECLGTDDPAEVQALVANIDKFLETAETIKQCNPNYFTVGTSGELFLPFLSNRSQPWIVDGELVIDPKVEEYIDFAKLMRENGYESQAQQWTEGWFAGMNDSLVGADGTSKKVFSYFLPTWGLPYVLFPNSGDTGGDWAMINGPLAYQWGGTWVGTMADSKNLPLAKEFITFVTLNEENLTNWATGVYTNEYLKAIAPSVPDDQAQAPGDFVSSQVVVEKITASFDGSALYEWLGGQNNYEAFGQAAPNVNGALLTGSDDAIQRALESSRDQYLNGEIDKATMWAQWLDIVRSEFPDLVIPEAPQ